MAKRRGSKKVSRKRKRSMKHLDAWRKHLAECHAKMGGPAKVSLKEAMKRCSKTYKTANKKSSSGKKRKGSRKKSRKSKRSRK